MLRVQFGRPVGPVTAPPVKRTHPGIVIAKGIYRPMPKVARWGWSRRRPLAPLYAALLLQLAGWILAAAPQGGRTACVIALIGAVSLRVSLWRLEHNSRPLEQRRLVYVWGVYATAVLWLVIAAGWGAGPPMPGLLLLGMLGAGVPWWWHHRIRPIDTPIDELLDTWHEKMAGSGGSLPGTFLINQRPSAQGRGATIDLRATRFTADDVVRQLPQITAAYRKPRGSVVVERTEQEYEHLAELLVLDENPTHGIIEYDESWQQLEDGCVPIGIFPDGKRGWTRIFEPGSGPVHELYSGDSGSGKSRGLETAILQSAATGLVIPWVADPQGGQSLPAWAGIDGRSPYAATTTEQIFEQLHAARAIMYARSRELARAKWKDEDGITRRGLDFYDHTVVPWMPIIEITIDEAHRVLEDETRKSLCEEIILMSRKTGIRLRFATQYPALPQLGNSMVIRSQLAGGNVVCYRLSSTHAKQMILPSWLPSPSTIPKRLPNGDHSKGMCVVDTTATGSSRGTFMRSVWPRRAHYWADQVAQRIPVLDDISLEAWENSKAELKTAETPETAVPDSGSHTIRESILEHLHKSEAPVTTGVIARDLNVSLSTVSTTLSRLAADGEVRNVRRGVWTPMKERVHCEAA